MMWRDVISIGSVTETTENGEVVQTATYRDVFANKKSVKRYDKYQSMLVGLKPELVFEINTFEFDNDERVMFNGNEYDIINAYESGEITELTVTRHTGGDI